MAERFRAMQPVSDSLAADAELLNQLEQHFCRVEWADIVARSGGIPVGEPEISRLPNPNYGLVVNDEDGEPLRTEDGEFVVDHTKFYLVLNGWAERA